jgi:hypothetical protein
MNSFWHETLFEAKIYGLQGLVILPFALLFALSPRFVFQGSWILLALGIAAAFALRPRLARLLTRKAALFVSSFHSVSSAHVTVTVGTSSFISFTISVEDTSAADPPTVRSLDAQGEATQRLSSEIPYIHAA